MTFKNLGLHPSILKALENLGYNTPTEIQEQAIPHILAGGDLRASAQTGTGKTAAFLLPALNRLTTRVVNEEPKEPKTTKKREYGPKERGPRVLILAPTRELAMQIHVQAMKYGKCMPQVKSVCISGGVPYHGQMRDLSRPYDILIATPGRLIDFIERRMIQFSKLEMLILDEADRMLDMGFLEPVEEIVAATPSARQTLLFSATMQGSVMKLSERLLSKPHDITAHKEQMNQLNIQQKLLYVDDLGHKNRLLDHLLKDPEIKFAIIFTSTKRHADVLVDELFEQGHQAAALHGDMNQRQRTRTITGLRNGKIRFLVATDVAARGIDVQSITHVINFDLPRNLEDYVHRIGRTGRAGAKGVALSFASWKESLQVKKLEQFIKKPIEVVEIPGFEPKKRPKEEIKRKAPNRNRNSKFGNSKFKTSGNSKKPFFGKRPVKAAHFGQKVTNKSSSA